MALTEHEQEILSELEYSLFAQDPQFGESLNGRRMYARTRGVLRWSVAGFVVGAGCLVAFFTSSTVLSLLSLATMFVSSVGVLTCLSALKRMKKPLSRHPSVRVG